MARKRMSVEELAALVQRGDIRQEKGDSTGALREYELAIREAPDDPMIWNNRGVALSSLGRFDEAIGSYRKATEITPGYWKFWFNLGKVMQRKAAKMAPKTGPPGRVGGRPAGQGLTPEQERTLEETIMTYDRALLLNPAHTSTLNNKAVAMRELRMYEEALSVYDELLGVDPLYSYAWFNKGKLLDILGLPDEAKQCYEAAASLNPDFAKGLPGRDPAGTGHSRKRHAIADDEHDIADEPGEAQTDQSDGEPPGRAKRK